MGWEAVGTVAATLGNMLLQSLFDAGTNTLTDLMTQAISGAIGGVSDAIKSVFGANNFLSGAVDTFGSNLEQSLNSTVATLTNSVNQSAQMALGISNAQQDLAAQLNGVTEGLLDGVNQKLALEQEQQQRTGAVLTDYMLEFVSGNRKKMETFGNYLAEVSTDAAGGEAVLSLQGSDRYLQEVMKYMEADLSFVEGHAVDLDAATYKALMDEVDRDTTDFKQWYKDTVVVPIANYNAMVSALKKGFDIDEEDFKKMLGAADKAAYEYKLDRLQNQEVAPGVGVPPAKE